VSEIQIPPILLASKTISAPVERVHDLERRLRAEEQTLQRAGHELEAARAEDRTALAQALVDGEKDPGTKATDKAQAKLETASRMAEALDEALRDARRELVDVIAAETPRLLQEAEQRLEQQRTAYADALDALATAHGELQAAAGTLGWLREQGLGRYQPAAYVGFAPFPAQVNGAVAVPALIDGLRKVGQSPPERPKQQHRKFPGSGSPSRRDGRARHGRGARPAAGAAADLRRAGGALRDARRRRRGVPVLRRPVRFAGNLRRTGPGGGPVSASARLFARLAPLAYDDANHGNVLAALAAALASPREVFSDMVRDDATHIAWGAVLDPDACPAELLDWLGIFAGVELPPSATTEAEKRYRIKQAAGRYRGTPRAVIEELQLVLTGTKTVYLGFQDGDQWHYTVGTISGETPDTAAADRAIQAQKPVGMIATRVLTSTWSCLVLGPNLIGQRATVDGEDSYVIGTPTYPTCQSVVDHFFTAADLLANNPH